MPLGVGRGGESPVGLSGAPGAVLRPWRAFSCRDQAEERRAGLRATNGSAPRGSHHHHQHLPPSHPFSPRLRSSFPSHLDPVFTARLDLFTRSPPSRAGMRQEICPCRSDRAERTYSGGPVPKLVVCHPHPDKPLFVRSSIPYRIRILRSNWTSDRKRSTGRPAYPRNLQLRASICRFSTFV